MNQKTPFPQRRRLVVVLACGLGGAVGLAGLASRTLSAAPAVAVAPAVPPAAPAVAPWSREDAAHLLRRAGFGGTPEQIDRLFALGRDGAVEYLLSGTVPAGGAAPFPAVALEEFKPEGAPEGAGKGLKPGKGGAGGMGKGRLARLRRLARLGGAPGNGAAAAGQPDGPVPQTQPKAGKVKGMQRRQEAERLRDWWLQRMMSTDRPLEEKMSLFWHGLFTSGLREVKNPYWMYEQNDLFHRQSLGSYLKLTHAVIHGPAMLKYLNNDENVKGKPNENLARELMELFTMGEGSGYTEADIGQVARALTGLAPTGKNGGVARMREDLHDGGVKTVFGKSGNFGPDEVVDLIFTRPQPARHLAKRLWEFFAYPNPSDADLQPVVDALVKGNYEVKPALRAIFTSPAFYSEKAKFALIKSPTELAVETARNLGLPADAGEARLLDQQIKAMDQVLLQPPNVRGWVGGDNWITAATLYARYNTACGMVNGNLRGGGGMKGMGMKKGNGAGGAAEAGAAAEGGAEPAPGMTPPVLAAGGEGPGAVSPAKLFPGLPVNPTAGQVVDAAVSRFLQRPLNPEKRSALLQTLNDAPIHLGTQESDRRVREMIGLLLSTPEYQVH